TPASYTGGWPDETASTGDAIAAAVRRLGAGGGWEDMGWPLASQRLLDEWWPRPPAASRDQLARRTWARLDELDPAPTPDGALILVEAKSLHGLRLMPPDAASFERFLSLARGSKFKLHELRAAARLWWERTVPSAVKARAPEHEPAKVLEREPEADESESAPA